MSLTTHIVLQALILLLTTDFLLDSTLPFLCFAITPPCLAIYLITKVGLPKSSIERSLSYFFVSSCFSWHIPNTPTLTFIIIIFFQQVIALLNSKLERVYGRLIELETDSNHHTQHFHHQEDVLLTHLFA